MDNSPVPNHERLHSITLKAYRSILIVVVAGGVIGLFNTRELVVRLDERLASVEGTLYRIEARQYNRQARDNVQPWDE